MSEQAPRAAKPNRGQFQKGRSGNPGGRPSRGQTALASAFDVVVNKTLSVSCNGMPREVTMEEALQHRTYQDAIAGKRMAQRQVVKWIEKREAWLEKNARKPRSNPIKVVRSYQSANANAALLLLGIATKETEQDDCNADDPQLLLEPWAVQMALSRRRGRQALEQKQIDDIKKATRDADRVRWPRGRSA